MQNAVKQLGSRERCPWQPGFFAPVLDDTIIAQPAGGSWISRLLHQARCARDEAGAQCLVRYCGRELLHDRPSFGHGSLTLVAVALRPLETRLRHEDGPEEREAVMGGGGYGR